MITRFNSHFSIYPTKSVDYTEPTVTPIPNTTNQYEVYPEFLFTIDNVTDEQDVDTRWQAFIEDCETALRNLVAKMPNTTILKVHYHTADGQAVETEF